MQDLRDFYTLTLKSCRENVEPERVAAREEPIITIDYDVPHPIHNYLDFVINLQVGGSYGRVALKKIDEGLLETHSSLASELRGLGYGIMMYSAAIRYAKELGFRVCSSPKHVMTASAKRLWASKELARSFTIVSNWERFYVV